MSGPGWFPTFRLANHILRRNLTPLGKLFLAGAMAASVGLAYPDSPLPSFLAALIAALATTGAICWLHRPRLAWRCACAEDLKAGQVVSFLATIENQGRRAACDMVLEASWLPPGLEHLGADHWILPDLAPGQSTRVEMRLRAARRGISAWPAWRIVSTFPFGLFRLSRSLREERDLVVGPRPWLGAACQAPPRTANNRWDDRSPSTVRGEGIEFHGSREYREGLIMRRWDFASWARTGKPFVREYLEEKRRNAGLWIDAWWCEASPPAADEQERWESLLSYAALLLEQQDQLGVVIDWVQCGDALIRLQLGDAGVRAAKSARLLAQASLIPRLDWRPGCLDDLPRDSCVMLLTAASNDLLARIGRCDSAVQQRVEVWDPGANQREISAPPAAKIARPIEAAKGA